MRPSSLIVLLLLFSNLDAAENEYLHLFGQAEFYGTATGTLAYLPNVRIESELRHAAIFDAMPESGAYTVSEEEKYCFLVNHRSASLKNKTYLGVAIFAFMSREHDAKLSVAHKSQWQRTNDENYFSRNGRLQSLKVSPFDFSEFHNTASSLEEFDRLLGIRWHGELADAGIRSWDTKYYWDIVTEETIEEITSEFNPPLGSDLHTRLDTMLISFTPTSQLSSESPLGICVTGESREAIYLKTFSESSPDFDREYFISIE